MVVTTEREWGGWRVNSAEYDLDPLSTRPRDHRARPDPAQAVAGVRRARRAGAGERLTKLAQLARRIISEISS
jgi:hypothetical protein